ncbi:MAG: 50S ribosomal protein L24 [bacterium]
MAKQKQTSDKVKLHVKSGDRVIVVSGKDKGKIGSVKKALPAKGKVIVEGVNIVTKAVKANPATGVQGGLIKREAAMNSSKVMLYCPKCEKPTRIRHQMLEDKKVRVCKKCGEQLD